MKAKHILRKIKHEIILSDLNSKWKKKNHHNHTSIGLQCNLDCIKVGRETYGTINANSFDHKPSETVGLEIGNYCSIADNVYFLLAGEHELGSASTFPFARFMPDKMVLNDSLSKGKIIVEDDVWIGYGATILSGVKIGQGAVVATGAVVTKNVPAYAVVGGVPAKVIRYRFSPDVVQVMCNMDYSKVDFNIVEQNPELFHGSIEKIPVNELKDKLIEIGVYKGTNE